MSNANPTFVRGHEEPDELRDSRPVLREPRGESPPGYSTMDFGITINLITQDTTLTAYFNC